RKSIRTGHGSTHDWIEATHECTGDETEDKSASIPYSVGRLAFAIGHGVANDRRQNERDAAEEQPRVALRREQIAAHGADDKSKADANRKRHRHARDFDRGDQQDVCNIEERATEKRCHHGGRMRVSQFANERQAGRSKRAKRESARGDTDEKSNDVIPVKKLEAVAMAELHGVGP